MESVLSPGTRGAGESQDDEAMQRVAGGDGAALAELFDRHKTRLYGFLFHLVGNRAAAEDLLGETFLRLYQARRRYRSGSGFRPWLFAIARNLALGELRHRSVVTRAQGRLVDAAGTVEDGWDARRQEIGERVRAALARLPEEQRSALVLKEYQQMEYREIGQVLGCSETAARARTYRARVTLREALREWWEAEP
jgi:RNA polymerase sigma-70 factor (ECF subfamily)